MAPAWIVSFRLKSKRDKSAVVKSHIDNIIHSVWTAFGISNVIFLLILFGLAYSLRMYDLFYLVNPVIMLIVGIGGYITAKVCRFRPFMHGAIAMWTGSLVSALAVILTGNGNGVLVQFIILSVCMIIGFVIPGHKLNKLAKESHV
jgi:hypothetical protein